MVTARFDNDVLNVQERHWQYRGSSWPNYYRQPSHEFIIRFRCTVHYYFRKYWDNCRISNEHSTNQNFLITTSLFGITFIYETQYQTNDNLLFSFYYTFHLSSKTKHKRKPQPDWFFCRIWRKNVPRWQSTRFEHMHISSVESSVWLF